MDLKVVNKSPWLKNIKTISLPIAHGEGKYIGKNSDVAFKYTKGEICKFQNLEKNPNGSDYDIAGVLGYNGRVLGLMPHPERAMFSHQSPLWPRAKASLVRGKYKNIKGGVPSSAKAMEGKGLQIFKNAINYFFKT